MTWLDHLKKWSCSVVWISTHFPKSHSIFIPPSNVELYASLAAFIVLGQIGDFHSGMTKLDHFYDLFVGQSFITCGEKKGYILSPALLGSPKNELGPKKHHVKAKKQPKVPVEANKDWSFPKGMVSRWFLSTNIPLLHSIDLSSSKKYLIWSFYKK